MVFDYAHERTFTDMMIRDFGEDKVEKVNFSAGTSGTKVQLKQDGPSNVLMIQGLFHRRDILRIQKNV